MYAEKAKCLYLGKCGEQRMNCAQAVANAFKEPLRLDDEWVDSLQAYGSGRAPDGLCGGYYAAACILEKAGSDKGEQLKNVFLQHAGSLKCKEIRGMRTLPCPDCVEKSAAFIESELPA